MADTEDKNTYPYCGSCGHIYFYEDKLTREEAEKDSECRRCKFCIKEEEEVAEITKRRRSI